MREKDKLIKSVFTLQAKSLICKRRKRESLVTSLDYFDLLISSITWCIIFMIRNYFHLLHIILLVWITVDTGSRNGYSMLWPICCQFFFILSNFYGLPPQLFLLISHSSIFSPFDNFSWWVPVFSGSLICQTALCFLEYICVPQTGNCWTLYRIVAALTHIFTFVLNHDFS